jgi:hypothetical protein
MKSLVREFYLEIRSDKSLSLISKENEDGNKIKGLWDRGEGEMSSMHHRFFFEERKLN